MRFYKGIWIIGLATVLILTAFLTIPNSQQITNAQDEPLTMKQLIEELNKRTHSEPGFSIHFSFAEPLYEGQDTWVIPTGDAFSLINRIRIDSIGTDYICFGDLGGVAYAVQCTPFSNIVQVFYLDN